MPKFFYIARDKAGQKVSGAKDAVSQEEMIGRLQAEGLLVISVMPGYEERTGPVNPADLGKSQAKKVRQHYAIKGDDLVLFCRQLATLLGAGVTIVKSLDIISQQVASRRLYNIVKAMQKSMEGGASFHEAMAKHGSVFSELWINLVESGEASGNLAMVLGRLATYLEKNAAFKAKIISALTYPCMLFVVGLGALLFMTIKIVPTFATLFKGFDIQLPFLTQVLLSFSNFIQKYFLFIIVGTAVAIYLFRQFIKTPDGRRAYERFLFGAGIFGDFFKAMVIERFTSEMSTLVESGVPILYSLEIAQNSVGSAVVKDIIQNVKENVREGKPLNQPLQQSGFFDPMVVQMVAIGEEIGELPSMFKKLNTFYQEYVETFLARFTALFEPFMLIFMGGVIGIMVVGMFLPIFEITKIK